MGRTVSANFTSGQDKYGLIDFDNDGLPTWYERQFGLREGTADATTDTDSDGPQQPAGVSESDESNRRGFRWRRH
jgi:hypothetical protein